MGEIKDFNDLADIGKIRKTVKIGNHEIVLHTLASDEYSRMAERLGDDSSTTAKRMESLQREILAAAIESIDGKALSHDERSKLMGVVQVGFSNMLYEEYGAMIQEQAHILDDAKKNSAQTTNGSTK